MLKLRSCLTAVAVALLLSQVASAHFLWIVTEQADKAANTSAKVKVYFSEAAEPDDAKLLEKCLKAEAWSLGSAGMGRRAEPKAITLKQVDDALEGEISDQTTAVILKHTYGVRTKGDDSFLLTYYAKTYSSVLPGTWTAVKESDKLPLEITPSINGLETVLKVTWKGEPLAGSDITVTGPGLTKLELKSDAKGIVRCTLPEAGMFSIRAKHTEATKGELDGQAYGSIRHYSTLSLRYQPTKLSPAGSKLPPLPEGTTSFGGAIAGDALYVYGGNYGTAHKYSSDDQSGDLWKLDLKNPEKWEQLKGGPKLQGLAMVEYKGKLYRVGGFTAMNTQAQDQNIRSQTEFASYDPATKEWTQLTPLPEARSSHDAALIGDTLYVVGGWNMEGGGKNSKWHETALSMNLSESPLVWKNIPTPPFQRRALALGAFEGKLYCLGGMGEKGGITNGVAVFDPASSAWSAGPALLGGSMDGFGASTFACNGALYVTTITGSIQRLSEKGTAWEYLGQIAHPRFFHRLLTWENDKLIVVGGTHMTNGKTEEVEVLSVDGVKTAAAVSGK